MRTLFPPINIYQYLKNNNKLTNSRNNDRNLRIHLRKHVLRIDRIQFSVLNRSGLYKSMLTELRARYKYLGPKKVKGNYIHQFDYMGGKLALVRYGTVQVYFTLTIFDPTDEIQLEIQRLVRRLDMTPYVNIAQVEFALDLYPQDMNEMYNLRDVLSKSLMLKHARPDSCSEYKGTVYYGLKGDVRKGSKGLRLYHKPPRPFFRVELQANNHLLRREEIGSIYSLPIDSSRINIYDHLGIRRGLRQESLKKLITLVCKHWPSSSRTLPRSKMAESVRVHCIRNLILQHATESGSEVDLALQFAKPVGMHIDIFKKLKKEYGMTNQVDEFFPKQDTGELMRDVQKGYVRRDYFADQA